MEQLEDEYAIGLDLGTTFSCIGVYRNGWVEIIPNKNGEPTTPSVVIISNEHTIIGEDTTKYLVQNYDSCIYEVKRLIGREINQKELDELNKRLSFKIIKPHSKTKENYPEISININGKNSIFSPVEISSLIIKQMVYNAEQYLKKKITKLVITVPANFNDAQRALTGQAAEALNLKVLRIINEPTAAALAYGFDKKKDLNCNILIFDLGGGTFDVSILSLQKDKNTNSTKFDVLATAGDTNLGGEDFDNELVDIVLSKIEEAENAKKIRNDKKAMKALKVACENAKKILSISDQANIHINEIIKGVDIIEIIKRKEFEEKCQPLFDKLIEPITRAIDIAKEKKKDLNIDEVILVGGSTRIPKVKEIVKVNFPNSKINDSINPDEAVAYGATIAAEKILHNRDDTIKNFSLFDITPISLGTDVLNHDINSQNEGSIMDIIIKRGTHIPFSGFKKYSTVSDGQTSMSINIYEGEKKYVKYNHLLKQSNIDGLTKRPKGQTKVVIKFDIDVNGILNVEAKEESPDDKGQIVNLIIKNDEVSLNKDEMEQLKKKMINLLDKFGKNDNTKDNDYINIKQLLKGYKEAFEKINEKIKNKIKNGDEDSDEEDDRIIYIKNYYSTLEKFIDKFDKKFDNETILYKYYLYVKDLFQNYIEALQLDLDKGDKEHIFKSIKEYIQIFINNSAGYLNDLIDVLSKMKKKKNKKNFYELIVFIISKLNELGRITIISDKPFCKHHSLMYFEQSKSYFEKYFPKKIENEKDKKSESDLSNENSRDNEQRIKDDRENIALLLPEDIKTLKKESKLCLDYINDIKSGAILFCEEFLKKGLLIDEKQIETSNNRGVTEQIRQYNIANLNNMKRENQRKLLRNYENLLSNIQITNDFTKKEALCIASIIKIYYIMDKENFSNKVRYLLCLARRCEVIVDHLPREKDENLPKEKNEKWYKEFTELYNNLKKLEPQDKNYPELLKEMKAKNPNVFKEIEDIFMSMATKDFFKFIVEKHPYKGKENDAIKNFNTPDLLTFLLGKYSPDDYKYSKTNEDSKLKYCVVQEISKKLNSLFSKKINSNK